MGTTNGTDNGRAASAQAATWALTFACLLHAAWIGAWLLAEYLERRGLWMTGNGERFAYWLALKLLLWVAPALVIIHLSGQTFPGVMGVGRVRALLLWGGGVGIILGLAAVAVRIVGQQPLFASPLGWPLISGVLVAPVIEEITFRGAILTALKTRFHFWFANLITGLLFLGIHLPGWYFQGRLGANLTDPVGGALAVLWLGLIFGYVAHKSRSVAAATLCHSLNNLFNA